MNPVVEPYRAYECQACLRMQIQPSAAKPRRYCKRCGFPPNAQRDYPDKDTESTGAPTDASAGPDVLVTAWPKNRLDLP